MRDLLDVNVWVALLDQAHVFHAEALAFIERRKCLVTLDHRITTTIVAGAEDRHLLRL